MIESLNAYLASLTSDIESAVGHREWDCVQTLVAGYEAVAEFAAKCGIITESEADARIAELGSYLDAVGYFSE